MVGGGISVPPPHYLLVAPFCLELLCWALGGRWGALGGGGGATA